MHFPSQHGASAPKKSEDLHPQPPSLDKFVIIRLSMPRTILVRPPGGATGRVSRRYAIRQKLQLFEECNRLRRVENLSLRGTAAVMSIPHTVLVRWTKARPGLIASLGRMKAICEGPVGQLDCIREELLQWIFARREQGIAVTMPHVVYKASSILRHQQEDTFKDKCFEARSKTLCTARRQTRQRGPQRRCTRR